MTQDDNRSSDPEHKPADTAEGAGSLVPSNHAGVRRSVGSAPLELFAVMREAVSSEEKVRLRQLELQAQSYATGLEYDDKADERQHQQQLQLIEVHKIDQAEKAKKDEREHNLLVARSVFVGVLSLGALAGIFALGLAGEIRLAIESAVVVFTGALAYFAGRQNGRNVEREAARRERERESAPPTPPTPEDGTPPKGTSAPR